MARQFHGRAYELAWLSARLSAVGDGLANSKVILLHGEAGVGKSSLVNALLSQDGELAGGRMCIAFRPPEACHSMGVAAFAEALLLSGWTQPGYWQGQLQAAGESFAQASKAQRAYPDDTTRTEAYSHSGHTRVIEPPTAVRPPGLEESEAADLAARLLDSFFARLRSEDGARAEGAALVFALDDFTSYTPSVKKWLGSLFVSALAKQRQVPVPIFLLTAQESWDVNGQVDYWFLPSSHFLSYAIRPLDRATCLQWLMNAGYGPAGIDVLMESTDGMPARVAELLADENAFSGKLKEDTDDDVPGLGASSAKERRWLHAAGALGSFSRENLSVLLGAKECEQAFHWLTEQLKEKVQSVSEDAGEVYWKLHPEAAKQILDACRVRVPSRDREFKERVERLRQLMRKVPSAEERESLRKLVPIQPFDSRIIERVYGHDE